VAAAIVVWVVLEQVNQRLASPVIAIVDRWLRWIIFGFGGAAICQDFELVDRPYWALAACGLIVWFLGETLFNWLAISALSTSPLPLFPRYVANQSGEEWPVQPRLLKVREWLRGTGLKQVQPLRAEIGTGLYLRASVYQDETATLRLQVTFLPQASGAITVCYSYSSVSPDGFRDVTDNLYIPFGGFYPETWFVDRRPCCRSVKRLLEIHRARLERSGRTIVPFSVEPAADLNEAQRELDRINTELGFLHRAGEREDNGKITHEGRYRVWKEIWMLNYLGRAARYV
jgi:hypothetical protein